MQSDLPKRSRQFGVGKEIGYAIWLHRQYEDRFGEVVSMARQRLPLDFDYTVVKFDRRTGNVSFIQSPDFDTADEPVVGESIAVRPDGTTRRRQQSADPEIYHHKWLFVADDYNGFDLEEAKERSRSWLTLDGIDFRRIGRRSVWASSVVPRIESIESNMHKQE